MLSLMPMISQKGPSPYCYFVWLGCIGAIYSKMLWVATNPETPGEGGYAEKK